MLFSSSSKWSDITRRKKNHPSTDKTQNHLHMETIATQTINPNKKKSKCLPWSERLILKISYAPFDTLFLFCSIFFSFDLPDYCETFGCPMTDDCQCIPSYRIISFAHIECMTKFQKKKQTKHFYCIQNTNLCYFFILSCTFFWHVFGFDMAFYCFVHNVVIVVDVFVFFLFSLYSSLFGY